jgi:RNA polymerase sigma-70 factor, ECF subfamily
MTESLHQLSEWPAVDARSRVSLPPEVTQETAQEQVGRAARGEPDAQAWLLEEVTPRVRSITRAFLRSDADADDAAQLALLAILRSAQTFRGEASLSAWAKRIAVRTTLRFLRRERRMASAPSPIAEVEALDDLAAPPPSHASEAVPRDVREYLDELPEAQRSAVVLHHALGCSIDEIAALLEASPDTVKSRVKLGMAALRKRIRQEIAIGRRRQP